MNTPITFEIAKLLKEKGFIEVCEKVYRSDGLLYTPSISGSKLMHSNILEGGSLSAPSIGEVVMWLYKKYGIWVNVDMAFEEKQIGFWYCIRQSKIDDVAIQSNDYPSPKEAYEAAIEYILNKLI